MRTSAPLAAATGRVLLVEDDEGARGALRIALNGVADEVIEVPTATAALEALVSGAWDLVVLDLALPDMDGLELCREIRRRSQLPILVVTGHHEVRDKVALLDAGADDYVTKPFQLVELRARVRARLRRAPQVARAAGSSLLRVHNVSIDFVARVAHRDGAPIHLTPIEWELLRVFTRHAGHTLSHRQLFAEVWPGSKADPNAYLRVHVANLRRKIEPDPSGRPTLIVTVPGVGYRMESGAQS